jgi:glycosyltransferase involved in cell wall biosynthesis
MRICFVTAQVGTQHHTMMRAVGMAPVLAASGHSVAVVAEDHPDNRQLLGTLPNVECQYVTRSSARGDIRAKAARIQGRGFDVIHSCGLDPRTFVPRHARRGAFWIVDHVERLSALTTMPWHKRAFWRWAERRALFAADGTIAASRYLEFLFRSQLFEKATLRPLLWLPYAVPESFVADIRNRQASRPKQAEKTLLFAGGFYRAYGVYDIVAALALLKANEPRWKFLFLGKGPEKQGLIDAVAGAGLADRVTFTGYMPMPDYIRTLAEADVLISPMHDTEADWARCPSKLYYYVATRRPIVTAAIGENVEVLGDTGHYYEPGSPQSLAAALTAAMRSGDRVDFEAHAVPPENHTWQRRCDRYLKWLENSLG